MGAPILPHDQRPFIRLKKRTGTFPNGNPTYDPPAEFNLEFDMNKSTIATVLVDNTPKFQNTTRYIDSLTVGDGLIVVMADTDGTEYALFHGLVQSLEFQGNTNLVELHAIDTTTYGENTFLNSVIYQKFTSDEELRLDADYGSFVGFKYTQLPADTTSYAPVLSEMRQCYGKHLTSAIDYWTIHKCQLVYSAPTPDGFQLRGVGGLGREDTGAGTEEDPTVSYPADTDPMSAVEKEIYNGNFYKNREFYYGEGAKKVVSQVFLAGRDDTITNIFFPICLMMRRYPSQIQVSEGGTGTNVIPTGAQAPFYNGDWNGSPLHTGLYDWHEMVGVPRDGAIDTANFGQPYNTFGPGMDLKVTLVRCSRARKADAEDVGHTKYSKHVDKKEAVPSQVSISDLGNSYTAGVDWLNTTELPFEHVEMMLDADGNPCQIIIEPDNPVPAPHFPAGQPICHNYNIANDEPNYGPLPPVTGGGSRGNGHEFFMNDCEYAPAYTNFGWNLEAAPVEIKRGEHYALIFEMLGNPAHPKLDDGVDIGGTPNPGYLSPAVAWGVGVSVQNDGYTNYFDVDNPLYTGGEHLKTLLTDEDYGIVGYHGQAAWASIRRSLPGYSITFAPWDSSPLSQEGPVITGDNFGHWELEDWLSTQGVTQLRYPNTKMDDGGGGTFLVPNDQVHDFAFWRGLSDDLTQMFSVVGGGWMVAGENLYWKWDQVNNRILWAAGTAKFVPVTDIGNIKMSRASYYSNPVTGGLLRAGGASTVRDVFHSICSRVSTWANIVCDGTSDGADDVYGTGYNDVANYELSYWSAIDESAWHSVVKLAQEYDASVWIHTDLNGVNTLVFERKEPITDFAFNSGSTHQYCYSNRDEDPSNLKFLTYTKISQDIENMYSRFRVIGATPEGETGTSLPGLPRGEASGPPISWILDVPAIEAIIGYRKEFTYEAKKNITSFEVAKQAAEALKTIHSVDQYSGVVTLSGCHPIYKNPGLGLMFDRNAIIRVMDKFAVTTDSPTGTTNVFRVTGISYDSKDHKTDIKLTTVFENQSYVEAEKLLEQLKKNQTAEPDGQKFIQKVSAITPANPVADMTMTVMDSIAAIPAAMDSNPSVVDDDGKWYLVGTFLAGYGTIADDAHPLTRVQYTIPAVGTFTIDLDTSVYKWSKDSLTVIVEITKP